MTGRGSYGVLRWLVTAHAVVIFVLPVLAGRYLVGDAGMLAGHRLAADVGTVVGLAQLVAAAVVWWRAGARWPLLASLPLVAGEAGQYAVGVSGALDLHVPLGVALAGYVTALALLVWRPFTATRRSRASSTGSTRRSPVVVDRNDWR
jgi:hypothetical protein